MKKIVNLFLFLLSFSYISSCGYHLAGTGKFSSSLQNTSVQGVGTSRELINSVKRNLASNQINVVEAEQATALINILEEQTEKITLTVDSDGKAREFELILSVNFDVKRVDDSYLLKEQNISLSRDFVFDKSDLLGTNEEEQQLFTEMRNDAAKLMVYRLQSISDE